MSHRFSIKQTVRQDQKLIINIAMQCAFSVLQTPICELSSFVQTEIEKNPLLEITYPTPYQNQDYTSHSSSIEEECVSLYTHTLKEIHYHFENPNEKELATYIAGCLDEKGFFTFNQEEVSKSLGVSLTYFQNVLKKFQHMEPLGLGTSNVREALLVQLKAFKKEHTLIYTIVEKYFHYLQKVRVKELAKKLGFTEERLTSILHDSLKTIRLFPAASFQQTFNPPIFPDLFIKKEEGYWEVDTNDALLPAFRLHPVYLKSLEEKNHSRADQKFIREQLASAKWLQRILKKRKQTLLDIGAYLVKKQESFLEGASTSPSPMTMQELANAFALSPSTITRAVEGKYLLCPCGLIKLRELFTGKLQTDKGVISNKQAKNLLLKLICHEDKSRPLSDQRLSEALLKEGIPCARRTITKYRKELDIAAANKRKYFR